MAFQALQNYYAPAVQPPIAGSPNSSGALTIPEIAQAFQNDPRHSIAQRMMQAGGDTSPVASGGWAWADGIARALQGIAGGYVDHRARQRAERDQQTMMQDYQSALAGTDAMNAPTDKAPEQAPAHNAPYFISPDTPPPGGFQPPPDKPPAVLPQLGPQSAAGPATGPDMGSSPADLAAALHGRPAATVAPRPALAAGNPSIAPIPIARPMGQTPGAVPATSRRAAIVQLGHSLERQGFTVGANRYVGTTGFNPREHRTGEEHGDHMIDVNLPGFSGNHMESRDPQARARMDSAVLQAQQEGYRVLWNGNIYDPHGRGPSRPIPVRSAHDNNPSWQHLNHAHFEAPSGLRAQGGSSQQQAAGIPQNPASQSAAAPAANAPPVQYAIQQVETPAPAAMAAPKAPALRPAAESQRLAMGMALLKTGNPYLYQQARQLMDAGMGEAFQARSTAQQQGFEQDQSGYQSQLGDYATSHQQERGAAYDARQAERNEGFAETRQGRDHQFSRDERIGGQQFQSSERQDQNQFTHGERQDQNQFTDYELGRNINHDVDMAGRNNDAAMARTQAEITARRETNAQRRAAFLSTPAGARIANEAEGTVRNNNNIIGEAEQFLAINEQMGTGGATNNLPIISTLNRINNTQLQTMEAITSRISPLIRQAGSGSMSDRDLENFRRSVPNIQNNAEANRTNGRRLIAGMRRMNDYETARLEAMQNGDTVGFMRQWQAYSRQHSIDDGVSFDTYRSSIPTYNAQGQRQ